MTAEIESLVLEHLRAIRADIADIKREVTANSLQCSTIGQQLCSLRWAALTAAVDGSTSDVDITRRPGPSER